MRTNGEIVVDALMKRIPVKLNGRVYVLLDNITWVMVARKDTKTGEKYISYLKDLLPFDYIMQEAEKLPEEDIMGIVLALIHADGYVERYKKLPEMFHISEYEQELLDLV
jgi:hypothetical protein